MNIRAREVLQHRQSGNPKVSQAGIDMKTGKKWTAKDAVEKAEARLHHSALIDLVTTGQAGPGLFPMPHYDKVCGREAAGGESSRKSQLECDSREHGQGGIRRSSAVSHGGTCGAQNPGALSSLFDLPVLSSPAPLGEG